MLLRDQYSDYKIKIASFDFFGLSQFKTDVVIKKTFAFSLSSFRYSAAKNSGNAHWKVMNPGAVAAADGDEKTTGLGSGDSALPLVMTRAIGFNGMNWLFSIELVNLFLIFVSAFAFV